MKIPTAVATLILAASPVLAQTPSFTLIQPPPGYTSTHINALSADGTAAAGTSMSSTLQPGFYWTRSAGRTDFGTQAGLLPNTPCLDMSGDDQFVAGNAFGNNQSHIYRWSAAGGYENLGRMAGWDTAQTTGVNVDGSVIVGYSQNGGGSTPSAQAPYRWTPNGGFQNLGYLRPGSSFAGAEGVSRDGNVVVGFSAFSSTSGPQEAFRWTPGTGMLPIAPAAGSPFDETAALGISPNGNVIMGQGYVSSLAANHPFRWMASGGMIDLGVAPGALDGIAYGSNYDGSMILTIMSFPSGPSVPYLWLADSGFVRFTDYLTNNGLAPPTGYTYTVSSVSDDGRTFGGWIFASGVATGFVAAIPAPGASVGLMAAFIMLKRRARRHVAGDSG